MCLAERANLIQSGQPIDGGEREIAPERVAMPCDARSSPFVVIGSPGARMKALRADDTNSHCVVRGSVAFTGAFACVHGLYSINAGQTSRLSANAAFIPSMEGSAPNLILQASEPWSPETHPLRSASARARAVELVRVGHLLSISGASLNRGIRTWL